MHLTAAEPGQPRPFLHPPPRLLGGGLGGATGVRTVERPDPRQLQLPAQVLPIHLADVGDEEGILVAGIADVVVDAIDASSESLTDQLRGEAVVGAARKVRSSAGALGRGVGIRLVSLKCCLWSVNVDGRWGHNPAEGPSTSRERLSEEAPRRSLRRPERIRLEAELAESPRFFPRERKGAEGHAMRQLSRRERPLGDLWEQNGEGEPVFEDRALRPMAVGGR